MGSRLWLALLLLLTLLGGARLLRVGYLADDWIIMAHVARHGNAGAWCGSWLDTRGALFHRPIFTGLYALENQLFGADPYPAHVHHLLWHLLACGLLFALLRQLGLRAWAAFLGALLFAWDPYQAVSLGWLASRTGVVAATLTLLCCVAWLQARRSGRRSWMLVAGLAAGAAALTKESGYLAFLVLPAVDLLWLRPRITLWRMLRDQSPLILLGAGLLVLRYLALGTLAGGYGQPDGLLAGGDIAHRSALAFGKACLRLLAGVPPEYLRPGQVPWGSYAGAGLLALMVVVAFARKKRERPHHARALILLFALALPQLLLLLLAAGPTLSPINCQRWYGVLLFACAGLACLLDVLGPRLGGVLGICMLVLFAPAAWQGQNLVRRGDDLSKAVLSQVGKQLEQVPAGTDAVFVGGLPENYRGLPLFWWGFEDAFGPPFRSKAPPFPIYPVHRNLRVPELRGFGGHPPVEPLVYLAGQRPYQILVQAGPRGVQLTAFDFASQLTRALVADQIQAQFRPGRLLLTPAQDLPQVLPPNLGRLPISVQTRGLWRVDFFLFVPGKDLRMKTWPTGPELKVDLWNHLRDVAFNRGHEALVYVLALGFPDDERQLPHLSKLLTFRCQSR